MKKPVLTVGLTSPFPELACEIHGHTGDLPCPWPDCPEGVNYDEFDTTLIGANMITQSYCRRKWLSVDGSERYCWDIHDDTSWFLTNQLVREEIARLLPQRSRRPSTLYHYTNLEGLVGIVSSNHLWLTDYEFLNDSSEFRFSQDVASESLEQIDAKNYLVKRSIDEFLMSRDLDDVQVSSSAIPYRRL